MNFKNFYKKYIYRQKRQDFLHYVGISGTSLIFYLNGRIPRKRVIEKIIKYAKEVTKQNLTIEDFYY